MKKTLLAVAVFTAFIAQAKITDPIQINNALGVDKSLDYSLLTEMGPWDDRNYQLTTKDLDVLPFDDQKLLNVPVFFKVQYRKDHPETGRHYPRSLYQNFLGNYGGLLVDGIWHKEGLGNGSFPDDTYGATTSAQQNKVASNEVALETGVLGDESAIECNPTNKNNCVAGTNTQNGQTMYYSSDAGTTWTKSQTNPGSSCCDPTVDWSSDGTRVYQGDLRRSGNAIGVRWSVSTDQGHTWGPMQNITTTGSDKEFIHVDRSPSSAHQDNIYMTWHDGNVLQFARSTNLGGSFSTPLSFTAEPLGIGSDITTDSAGNVYYFYPSTNSNSGIRMLKSTNGGVSFAASTQVSALNGSFDIAIPSMETRKAFIYTSADVDRNNDTIYVAWTDEENDSAGGNNASANHIWINVSKSTNGGASWTSCAIPHDTSDSIAAGNAEDRFHPWIKVGDDSTVHIGYYDTRHSNNRTGVDFYYSTSTDGCNSWNESRFTTQTSSNLNDGQEWGDYNGLSVVLDKIAMTWTDNRSGKATYAGVATINGGNPPPPPPPADPVLSNGVAINGLSGSQGNQQNFTMNVPSGASNLSFNMSGGSGDADLYVKFGSAPTLTSYDCRPFIGGNNEDCPVTNAQTGTYHVMIVAFSTYSGASLVGSYSTSVPNVAPNASFTSTCTDLTCNFNASGSSDSDGTISNYSWSFGGSGVTTSNTFANAGTFSVTLTVTDNDGATDTSTQSVTVTAPSGGGSFFENTSNVNIPDNNPTGATSNLNVTRTGASGNIRVTYSIVHTYIGDLKVEIFTPTGQTAILRDGTGGSANNINEFKNLNAGSIESSGNWRLKVTDDAGQDTGFIDSWSVEFL